MAFVITTSLQTLTARRLFTTGTTTTSPIPRRTKKPSSKTNHGAFSITAIEAKPNPPKDFATPTPRLFVPRSDKLFDIVSGSAVTAVRGASGALVAGYRIRQKDGKVDEYSATLPTVSPEQPLQLFEFEACPFCRKVREAISILDLDVIVFPCPRDGQVYREFVKEKGGKAQFPYLIDPNTDFAAYESDDIINYLFRTYGPSDARVPFSIGPTSIISAGIASQIRRGRGGKRASKVVPASLPIELWGYEASPFVRIVREILTELEIPYYLKTVARGSKKRAVLKELTGRFQVPYIKDPNTDIAMFESADICDYLMATYGSSASGAVNTVQEGTYYMPGMPFGAAIDTVAIAEQEKSLDPQQEKDETLEEYCKDNPESDECRVYED